MLSSRVLGSLNAACRNATPVRCNCQRYKVIVRYINDCVAMWPGPRHTCMPSFILIRPTVWPQCTNVTDRTDRQRTDSIGRTVLQTVAQKNETTVHQMNAIHSAHSTHILTTEVRTSHESSNMKMPSCNCCYLSIS